MNIIRRSVNRRIFQKSFHKINKKQFFFSQYYSSNDELNIADYTNKNVGIYKLNEPLIFDKGAYQILKNNTNHTRNLIRTRNVIVPLNAFIGYKFVKSVYNLRPIKSVCYGVLLFFITTFTFEINKKLYHIIDSIDLLESGEMLRIHLANKKKFDIEIKKIRVIDKKELEFLVNQEDNIVFNYYPIVANSKMYFIGKECDIIDQNLFREIMKGNKIQIDKIIKKENALNI
jgi:hypothetical protein